MSFLGFCANIRLNRQWRWLNRNGATCTSTWCHSVGSMSIDSPTNPYLVNNFSQFFFHCQVHLILLYVLFFSQFNLIHNEFLWQMCSNHIFYSSLIFTMQIIISQLQKKMTGQKAMCRFIVFFITLSTADSFFVLFSWSKTSINFLYLWKWSKVARGKKTI